ncbi:MULTISPECIES: hypothetical protein [Amycolatopsis]|nr:MULTISPECIES: hypothetical protein [Amycolatopsis]
MQSRRRLGRRVRVVAPPRNVEATTRSGCLPLSTQAITGVSTPAVVGQ